MAGIGLRMDSTELDAAIPRVALLGDYDEDRLLSAIGALGESQTRRRIEEEKTAPDGTPWPPNREGTPILHRSGQNLLYSISWIAGPGYVEWGAGWEFAHIHQDGATITPKTAKRLAFVSGGRQIFAKKVTIPPRPFVGLSAENIAEIEDLVTDMLAGRLGP